MSLISIMENIGTIYIYIYIYINRKYTKYTGRISFRGGDAKHLISIMTLISQGVPSACPLGAFGGPKQSVLDFGGHPKVSLGIK